QGSGTVDMFVNRLNKNLRHLKRQAVRQGLAHFRVYDADLPEYAFSIDLFETKAIVKEYQAPKSVDPQKVLKRRQEVLAVLPELLSLPAREIYFEILPR
ncbi:MAG TPA: 23S rRNA (guanine(2445)-N(2))/(guanine(2069)-N(7))-methyltransferase, partial [Gammaproteobacteria bacterium]|nr:23S rRNA (guanine(2445)-N(2))/(guanine(2069)-N(7))-methyltransferase [Gammaproteobacteria bacterium]